MVVEVDQEIMEDREAELDRLVELVQQILDLLLLLEPQAQHQQLTQSVELRFNMLEVVAVELTFLAMQPQAEAVVLEMAKLDQAQMLHLQQLIQVQVAEAKWVLEQKELVVLE